MVMLYCHSCENLNTGLYNPNIIYYINISSILSILLLHKLYSLFSNDFNMVNHRKQTMTQSYIVPKSRSFYTRKKISI